MQAFVEETFTRNVRWLLDRREGDRADLAVLEVAGTASQYRLEHTLVATSTSLRLLMFQAYFLRQIAKPEGLDAAVMLQRYEVAYGRPPPHTARKLQAACADILGPLSWPKFFQALGMQCPSKSQLSNILRAAVERSEARSYHSTAGWDWTRLRERRTKADAEYCAQTTPDRPTQTCR